MLNLPADGASVNAPVTPLYPTQSAPAPARKFSPVRLTTRRISSRFTRLAKKARVVVTPEPLYDMAGSHVAGNILGRIFYWHQSAQNGDTRLRIEREGHMWLAKGYADFWGECRASQAEAEAAMRRLARLGLIECRVWKFNGEPTLHIRIIEDRFNEMWDQVVQNPNNCGTYRPRSGSKKAISKAAFQAALKAQEIVPVSCVLPDSLTRVSAEVTQEQQHRPREKSRPEPQTAAPDVVAPQVVAPQVVAPQVVAPQVRPDDTQRPGLCEQSEPDLLAQVLEVGVKRDIACHLIEHHGPEAVKLQLDCLDDRNPYSRPGVLVKALREDWSVPRAYVARLEARQAEDRARAAQAQQRTRKALEAQQGAATAQQRSEEEARLDAEFEVMPEPERARIEHVARGRLGVLGGAGRAPAALNAMRRNLQREAAQEGAPKAPPRSEVMTPAWRCTKT